MKTLFYLFLSFICLKSFSQTGGISGRVTSGDEPVYATVSLPDTSVSVPTDALGRFYIENLPVGQREFIVSAMGYERVKLRLNLLADSILTLHVNLKKTGNSLNEVVVTGTMKEVSRLESPVPVEVYSPGFFQKNPSPNLFEAIGLVNGVRPQLNCNVCNTGDIHINGMEGAYTMVLIDGMPIISSLSTVYGLSGVPNSLVERIEVVKGPASSLYGSEAMGGIVNVITKNPDKAPFINADLMATTWAEYNLDAAIKFSGKQFNTLFGINYFNYSNPEDKNKDGFTDVTLQNRVSVFNKWDFKRKDKRIASLALRYVNEDRWGGQMNWNKSFRGSDSIYGESIYTKRWEVISKYQLPLKEKIMLQLSYNWHDQNSYYATNPYMANQQVAFAQAYWDKQFGKRHSFLLGATMRYTYYDDNTPGTWSADSTGNAPDEIPLPGIFIQDEWKISERQTLLLGYRYDYDRHHGNIHSPRIAYKLSPNKNHTLRASFGTGFRVVNLFTEDHAALTGARQVIIAEELKPERSLNSNLNYVLKVHADNFHLGIDVTGFYSRFSNKIIGDFDLDPDKIIYSNLKGYAVSRGVSLNTELSFLFPLQILAGITYLDVYQNNNEGDRTGKITQLHAPKWSGNYLASYSFNEKYSMDITGTFTGPMRLPIQPDDFRPEYSPWFSIANIQLTRKFENGLEIYGGCKNVFDFIPKNPFMRPFDPFDKTADDPVSNPNKYSFDTEYNYAPIQGAKGFLGIRYKLASLKKGGMRSF